MNRKLLSAVTILGAITLYVPARAADVLPNIPKGDITIRLEAVPLAAGASTLQAPDYAISPPGDTNRMFIVEQNGLLRLMKNGQIQSASSLDIRNRVQIAPTGTGPLNAASPNDERGFLGLAFHPGFNNPASPGFRTLYTYTSEEMPPVTPPTFPVPTIEGATNQYKNVISEWKMSTANPDLVDISTRREILSIGKNAGNHNGGTIAFGPDGYLYLAAGDGGNANDDGPGHIEPGGNAQNLTTPLGKMLRLDPLDPVTHVTPDPVSTNGQYRIPLTNPFTGPGELREIHSYGFRNPYRFAFDDRPGGTGDLIEADVGQNTVEEINRVVLGKNYGWAIKEGTFLFNRLAGPGNVPPAGSVGANSPEAPGSPLTDPISGPGGTLEYDHDDGISITGGFVYRGTAIPQLVGKYVFGDLALHTPPRVDGRLFYADLQQGTIKEFLSPDFAAGGFLPNGLTVHGFGQDGNGELYALVTNTASNGSGGIAYKIILPEPTGLTVLAGSFIVFVARRRNRA